MIDPGTLTGIRRAIRFNEIGDQSPYRISFAGKGNSGGSFGAYQGDAHADQQHICYYLNRILRDANVEPDTVLRIVTAVSQVCLENPLSDADTALLNKALSSPAGRAAVDQMDGDLERTVLKGVELCIAAAATRTLTIERKAMLYIACWTNMTGAPNQLSRWLGGTVVYQLPSPAGPVVGGQDLEQYLRRTDYFVKNPRNFTHLQDSIAAGMA